MSSALPQLDLGNTFGALFIGIVLAAMSVDSWFATLQSKLT